MKDFMDRLEALDEAISKRELIQDDLNTVASPVEIGVIRAKVQADPPLEGYYICERILNSGQFGLWLFISTEAAFTFGWLLMMLYSSQSIHHSVIGLIFAAPFESLIPAILTIAMFRKLAGVYGGKIINRFLQPIDVEAATARAYDTALKAHADRELARQVWLMSQTLKPWREADGPTFERLTARAFRQQGWTVKMVGGANDGGVDLRMCKDGTLALVQCKAHAKPLSPATVRELYGALLHENADLAFLVCLSGVSSAAAEWAKGKPIWVLTPEKLIGGAADVLVGGVPMPAVAKGAGL